MANADILGAVAFDESVGTYCATGTVAGFELWICLDTSEAERVEALLPLARRVLADFERLAVVATAYLWEWGDDGENRPGEKEAFPSVMVPNALVLDSEGGFAVHFEDRGEYYMDGYWPSVWFDEDFTPVDVVIEA